jgi:mRNA interferase RelE/StbE
VTDRYQVVVSARTEKDLGWLPEQARRAIVAGLDALALEPRRGKPLAGELAGLWSLRRGDYRVVYRIVDTRRRVEVARVAHRRDAYRC